MATLESRCFFSKLYSCSEKTSLSQTSIQRVIQASKQYEDGLHLELEQQQEQGIKNIPVHRKCVDKYCHKKSIERAIHERCKHFRSLSEGEDFMSKPNRTRQSESLTFSFLQHCLFCGE